MKKAPVKSTAQKYERWLKDLKQDLMQHLDKHEWHACVHSDKLKRILEAL